MAEWHMDLVVRCTVHFKYRLFWLYFLSSVAIKCSHIISMNIVVLGNIKSISLFQTLCSWFYHLNILLIYLTNINYRKAISILIYLRAFSQLSDSYSRHLRQRFSKWIPWQITRFLRICFIWEWKCNLNMFIYKSMIISWRVYKIELLGTLQLSEPLVYII